MRNKMIGLCGIFGLLASSAALAQDGTSVAQFLMQVFEAVRTMGGLSVALKISALITLVISSMKVSVLDKLVWEKLGPYQVFVAPFLGLLVGLSGLVDGSTLSLPKLFAYVMTGAGAVFIHQILDAVKTMPGIGDVFVTVINFVEQWLGGTPAVAVVPVDKK